MSETPLPVEDLTSDEGRRAWARREAAELLAYVKITTPEKAIALIAGSLRVALAQGSIMGAMQLGKILRDKATSASSTVREA